MQREYSATAPSPEQVQAMPGMTVLEFGTGWCGHCIAAQPAVEAAFAGRSGLNHLKIEDGPGRRLGRSFRVKLWPTLVFLKDGEEVARVVRPASEAPLEEALRTLDAD